MRLRHIPALQPFVQLEVVVANHAASRAFIAHAHDKAQSIQIARTPVGDIADKERCTAFRMTGALRQSALLEHRSLVAAVGAPPYFGSDEHCKEIAKLLSFSDDDRERTQVLCEVDLSCWVFGDFGMSTLETHPQTSLLLTTSLWHLDAALFWLKSHFDRARPSMANHSITPRIAVPLHASYNRLKYNWVA